MNWKNFRKYSGLMTKIEKIIIIRRFKDWTEGYGMGSETIDDNWSDDELAIAIMMFEAGWVAARIEPEDEPILVEWKDN